MQPTNCDVIIIGGGLSGLRAAQRLAQGGRVVTVLEARERLGGRILTVQDAGRAGDFELGPAWFWGDHLRLQALLTELGMQPFLQFETGDALFDQGNGQPPVRFTPDWQNPTSFRIAGGVNGLINGLAAQLPAGAIHLGNRVCAIREMGSHLQVEVEKAGERVLLKAEHVIITLPPRLVEHTIQFDPPLAPALLDTLRSTQTWMGQAMKVVLVYPAPFWRQAGLSGLAVSHLGAVQQFHDHTPADEACGALFGWIGNQGTTRTLPLAQRRQAIIEQAVRLFGAQAGKPLHYAEMDWSQQVFTRAPGALVAEEEHPQYGHPLLQNAQMNGRLHWAGTEVSPVNGGYLDGAIYAGERVADRVLY